MSIDPNWRQAWRWLSVHAMTLALAVSAAWVAIPDDLRAAVPAWSAASLTGVLMVLGILGRLVKQPDKTATDDTDDTDEAGA